MKAGCGTLPNFTRISLRCLFRCVRCAVHSPQFATRSPLSLSLCLLKLVRLKMIMFLSHLELWRTYLEFVSRPYTVLICSLTAAVYYLWGRKCQVSHCGQGSANTHCTVSIGVCMLYVYVFIWFIYHISVIGSCYRHLYFMVCFLYFYSTHT